MSYFVVPMLLDIHGNGPEMDPEKIYQTVWQVWDWDFCLVAQYETEEEAKFRCGEMNVI